MYRAGEIKEEKFDERTYIRESAKYNRCITEI